MVGGGFMMNGFDDNTMIYGDVFDKIEDLLDFSSEEMQMLMEPEPLSFDDGHAADSGFPPVTNTSAVAAGAGASGATAGIKSDDDTFPCEDIDVAELEWLSNFVEESFSPTSIELPKSNTIINHNSNNSNNNNNNNGVEGISDTNKVELHYRTPSPVSVLEHNGPIIGRSGGSFSSSSSSSPTSSSCSSVGNGVMVLASLNPPEAVVARGRAPRTKRPRPPSGPRSNILMPFVPSSMEDTSDDSLLMIPSMNTELENFAESNPTTAELQAYQAPTVNKKKKLKIVSSASIAREAEYSQLTSATPVRKCMHCEIQKTPQWRAGPMGPKTLCNACGVRYKSGRLFPEYRPAASPTFVASQHSNSHKKVVEMRVKTTTKEVPVVAASLPVSAKGCELLNYIRSN